MNAPWFVLVGGINGSGKSTFAQDADTISVLTDAAPNNIKIINPDLVTLDFLKSGLPLREANLAAAQHCERQVDHLTRAANDSFAIETVLSTDKYVGRLAKAKAQGLNVLFVYMVLGSVDEAIRRVKYRVSKGGHNVPAEKIRERWSKSLERLPSFWSRATRSLVFFNGDSVKYPFLIAERRDGFVRFHENPPAAARPVLRSLLPAF